MVNRTDGLLVTKLHLWRFKKCGTIKQIA